MFRCQMLILPAMSLSAVSAYASVMEFTTEASWQTAATGSPATITFAGFPNNTLVTDQFADQGISFTGMNFISGPTPGFANDQWGLFSPSGLRFSFASPQNAVAVDYSGAVRFQLLNDGALFFTSTFFQPGGLGNFAGLVSDQEFDEVYIFRSAPFQNQVFIDDLHWGSAVPSPAAASLFAFVLFRNCRRRRN